MLEAAYRKANRCDKRLAAPPCGIRWRAPDQNAMHRSKAVALAGDQSMPFRARSILFATAMALALAGCGSADPAATEERVAVAKLAETGNGELALTDATVKLNANPAAPSAAYFTVKAGDLPLTITGVQSADVERAELHESKMEGGVMRMDSVTDVDVPANGEVQFRQGGLHVMLFGLSDAARAAGKLTLTVSFADGASRDVEAQLVNATGTPVAAAEPAKAAARPAAQRQPAPAAEPGHSEADHSEHGGDIH
jgi:periplasmic copper chaperone A